jgi:hypothetical protein
VEARAEVEFVSAANLMGVEGFQVLSAGAREVVDAGWDEPVPNEAPKS